MSSLDRAIIHRMALMTGGKRSQVDLPGGCGSRAAKYCALAPFLPFPSFTVVCVCVYVYVGVCWCAGTYV